MKKSLLLQTILITLLAMASFRSHSQMLTVKVIDEESNEALVGAVVQILSLAIGKATDIDGNAPFTLLPGRYEITVSFIGYLDQSAFATITSVPVELTILLKRNENETEEVVISSTRTNSRIDDLPMKVEVLGTEDMEEENGIKPGNVASILGDLSVIHIQQTSSVSAGSVVRMQGLSGRYTQLLRDGLPLYDGFSGNLNIMQLPPLDLKQIEIVKGSSSTLYGGGAISGMINMISKTPGDSTEASITLNQSSLNETNLNGFYSTKFHKIGLTIFAGHTNQKQQDINDDGFSDVPQFQNTLAHPRLFFQLGDQTNANLGYSHFTETRKGGDMATFSDNANDTIHTYFERNNTQRQTFEGRIEHRFNPSLYLNLKSSWNDLRRDYAQRDVSTTAQQITGYNEISLLKTWPKQSFVTGVNWISQQFNPLRSVGFNIEPYSFNTLGAFAQFTRTLSQKFVVEMGMRFDHHLQFGDFYLPRLSMLYKPNPKLSIRLGSGIGYKIPDPFEYLSMSDMRYYRMTTYTTNAEKSLGINNDIAYHTVIGEKLSLQMDQAFYYTVIKPMIQVRYAAGETQLANGYGEIQSFGSDTYVRLKYHPFELYLGYNHTQATQSDSTGGVNKLPYGPNDKVATTLAFEPGHGWRVGLEGSWVANQVDFAQQQKPAYWFLAAMVGKEFKHIRVVLNMENILDYRQSRVEKLYTGNVTNPNFNSLWAPIEGRVINLSVRFSL